MEKINRDETKFKSAILQCVEKQGKELMKTTEGYEPTLLIVLGKSKNHGEKQTFSIPFRITGGGETKLLAKKHLKSIIKAIEEKYRLRNTHITEYIFEFKKDDKLYSIRTTGEDFEMKESNGKYTY